MAETQPGPKVSALFPTRFISADDLRGKEITLQITAWAAEEVHDVRTGVDGWATVLYFQGAKKGLLLKKTNARTLAKLYGDEVGGWVGKWVTLCPTEKRAFGEVVGVVVVKPEVPVTGNGHHPAAG